jgi:hypothetical protein
MADKNKKYAETIKQLAADTDARVDSNVALLWALATKLDALRESLSENAKYMGEKFARYSADCADGHVYESTPCGYSTLNNIVADAAKYSGLHETFLDLFLQVTGKRWGDVRKEQA